MKFFYLFCWNLTKSFETASEIANYKWRIPRKKSLIIMQLFELVCLCLITYIHLGTITNPFDIYIESFMSFQFRGRFARVVIFRITLQLHYELLENLVWGAASFREKHCMGVSDQNLFQVLKLLNIHLCPSPVSSPGLLFLQP